MRALALAAVVLVIGCGRQDELKKAVEDGFVGEWESTGVGIPEDVTYTFTAKGKVIQKYPGEEDQRYSYRVETLADWSRRRSAEINSGQRDLDLPTEDSARAYVITGFDPARPSEHNPARQFLYNAEQDTMQLLLIAELRRVRAH